MPKNKDDGKLVGWYAYEVIGFGEEHARALERYRKQKEEDSRVFAEATRLAGEEQNLKGKQENERLGTYQT